MLCVFSLWGMVSMRQHSTITTSCRAPQTQHPWHKSFDNDAGRLKECL